MMGPLMIVAALLLLALAARCAYEIPRMVATFDPDVVSTLAVIFVMLAAAILLLVYA